jgi:hypothetical protein
VEEYECNIVEGFAYMTVIGDTLLFLAGIFIVVSEAYIVLRFFIFELYHKIFKLRLK